MNIPFHIPALTGKEGEYVQQAMAHRKLSGDGPFTKRCQQWLEQRFAAGKALLTTSCTHALEMAALLSGIGPGDEVIMPSYTFVSTANAFVLRGAKIVFVDIRPDTMNLDETRIEQAITPRTKAIVPVHYAGVSCDMDAIMAIADKYGLVVIEDAAQGVMSTYNNRPLGTIGHLGCFSFHETKNIQCGEGGALLINDERYKERAEIIREKGTNRSKFLRGQVDKYTWVDIGSSYLPSELNAAFLLAQLEQAESITDNRLGSWSAYHDRLSPLQRKGKIELPAIPDECSHNAHIFHIKCKDLEERSRLMEHLRSNGVASTFHFIPLHQSGAGKLHGRFAGEDRYTTKESERLLRLPLFFGIGIEQIEYVCETVEKFYE